MNNRENQLKTEDASWLAGMVEGDGYISICVYRNTKAKLNVSYKAVVGVSNQDATIINHVDNLFRQIGAIPFIQDQKSEGNTPVMCVSTSKLSNVKKILDSIFPYIVGEKKARAELVLKFVNRRLENKRQPLEDEDVELLKEMDERFISRKGKKTQFGRILNEYTLSKQINA